MTMGERQTLDISTSTILRFILIILGVYFVYLIRDVLFMVFVAVIIAAAIDGPVEWLARHRVRRFFGTAIVYLMIFVLLALFVYLIFPPLAGQIKALATSLPEVMNKLGVGVQIVEQKVGYETIQRLLENFSNQLSGAAGNVVGATASVFGGIFNAIMVLIISMYLVIQDKGIKSFLASLTPAKHQPYVTSLAERIQLKLGSWLRGQLLLMVIIGVLTFAGLKILGVKYALILALVAGLFEIIPYIGPIMAAIPAVALAFFQSPLLALLVLALYIIVQQLENYLITPQVMKRVTGLNSLVIVLALIIGGKIAGVLGVVVAVPIAAAISVFLSDFFAARER